MKKLLAVLTLFVVLVRVFVFSLLVIVLTSFWETKGSDNVHFRYFWWEDDAAYYIIETNVEGKTTSDRWEMIDVVIPTEYNGHPVTVIGWDSFRECQILRSVTIPEGITGIHTNAFFDCNNLESVHLPKSMRDFSGFCFASCNSLKEVTLDPDNPWFCSVDGVVYTKDQKQIVFYPPGKTDEEFAIPEGCEIIGRSAFAYCENLKRITIPKTVTDISYDSVFCCRGMEGVLVDEGNETYLSLDGNLYSKDGKQFLRLCVSDENVVLTLPDGVVEIGERAACDSESLTEVHLPKSLTTIGEGAFRGCGKLTAIAIPQNVTFVGSYAFLGCDSLTDAVFEEASGWSVVPQGGKFVSTHSLTEADLGSPSKAAAYLSEEYDAWEWYRGD